MNKYLIIALCALSGCSRGPIECGRVKRVFHTEHGCLGPCTSVAIEMSSRTVVLMGGAALMEGDTVCMAWGVEGPYISNEPPK